jgi:hypothetical protein
MGMDTAAGMKDGVGSGLLSCIIGTIGMGHVLGSVEVIDSVQDITLVETYQKQ